MSSNREKNISETSDEGRRPTPSPLLSLAAALSFLFPILSGCDLADDGDKRGHEVENEITATLFLADGTPAADASVEIFAVGFDPSAAEPTESGILTAAVTDDQGRFTLKDSLPTGRYNLLAKKSNLQVLQDSVFISGTENDIADDTLQEPGQISGFVKLQPGDDPRAVIVSVLGSAFLTSNISTGGFFTLPPMAAGPYRIALSTQLENYVTTFADIRVRSGRSDTLSAPIEVIYTGIPAVENLRASYDTLAGVVTISWAPVDYPELSEYCIYRDSYGASVLSTSVVACTDDTVWNDTVWSMERFAGYVWTEDGRIWIDRTETQFLGYTIEEIGTSITGLKYRLCLRNRQNQLGGTYGDIQIITPPPATASTQISFSLPGGKTVSINDTVLFVVNFDNPGRHLKKLVWYLPPSGEVLRSLEFDTWGGADSLRLSFPVPGNPIVAVEITDNAGKYWNGEYRQLSVILDPPVIQVLNPVAAADVEQDILCTLQILNNFGDYEIKPTEGEFMEWSLYSIKGNIAILRFTMPPIPGSYDIKLSVVDDDKNKAEASFEAWVRPRLETFVDTRDGKRYRKVRIDDKYWMAENLMVPSSGNRWYDEVCPDGWRLPTYSDWMQLIESAGDITEGSYGEIYFNSSLNVNNIFNLTLTERGDWSKTYAAWDPTTAFQGASATARFDHENFIYWHTPRTQYFSSPFEIPGYFRCLQSEFPVILKVRPEKPDKLNLSWTRSRHPDFQAYEVYLVDSAAPDDTLLTIIDGVNDTTLTLDSLKHFTLYWAGVATITSDTKPEPGDGEYFSLPRPTFTDPRDGQTYPYSKIGNTLWLAEDLRFRPAAGGFYQGNAGDSAVIYYPWRTVDSARGASENGLCPEGWRLPLESDVFDLVKSSLVPYGSNIPIIAQAYGGTDSLKFGARLGGYLIGNGSMLFGAGRYGGFWTVYDNLGVRLTQYSFDTFRHAVEEPDAAVNIRCVKE